ncbi:MAG: tetratricopeptide repeat protein [Desulfovibrio sp.]|nr:tetratricopeptide repeat protein [Desulfovibrio sp.]
MSKTFPLPFLCFLSIALLGLFLLNNSGCVGSRADAQETQAPCHASDSEQGLGERLPILPTQEFSQEAKSVYAFLLCDQAFRNEDETALLEATEILQELHTPPAIWMEAGIWLLGRKSPLAVSFLDSAHNAWPNDTSLLMLYAEALKEKGDTSAAIELVRTFLAKNPGTADATLELAILEIGERQYDKALALLKSIAHSERTPLVELNFGKALAGLLRYDEAVPYLLRAHKAMPDLPEALLELGSVYERTGQWEKAVHSYEEVLKTDFPSKNILLKLISLCLQQKKPEKALRYLAEAPRDIPFQLIVADMFIDAKNYLQATTILEPIVQQPNAPVEVYLLLADLTWEHLHDLQGALAWLDKMPEEFHKSSNALLLRVHLLARAEKKDEAVACAREGKARFANETKFWEAEARILASQGHSRQALKVMQEAVKRWPEDMNLLFLLGNILDESGDKKAAFKLMESIIAREPDNFQALNYVGYTLAEANEQIDRAVSLLERATGLAPDRAYIVDSLAWAYYRAGRTSDALREIRRAVSLGAKIDAAIWEHYGDIAKSSGLAEEARKAYARALELEPDNAEELRKKLGR